MTRASTLLLSDPMALPAAVLATRADALLEAASMELTPRRVLVLGAADVAAVARAFPTAELHLGSLAHPRLWPDAIDLLVVHFELSLTRVDLAQAVAELWSTLAEGGCLAVLDVGRVPDEPLCEQLASQLGRDLGRPLLKTLRRNLDLLHVQERQHFGGLYSTLSVVGRKGLAELP